MAIGITLAARRRTLLGVRHRAIDVPDRQILGAMDRLGTKPSQRPAARNLRLVTDASVEREPLVLEQPRSAPPPSNWPSEPVAQPVLALLHRYSEPFLFSALQERRDTQSAKPTMRRWIGLSESGFLSDGESRSCRHSGIIADASQNFIAPQSDPPEVLEALGLSDLWASAVSKIQ